MKLAVVSCAKLQQTNPQPVWAEIMAEVPDVLLLLGDNIYLDEDHHQDPAALAAELRARYRAQFAEPNFAALLSDLRARGGELLAIYDDHDFLGNDHYGGDLDPALGIEARKEFVRAFEPTRTGDDVYNIRRVGPADIIVLDARFYRSSPSLSSGDRDAVLGAKQWAWFEQAVAASSADYLVVGSSTTGHTWGNESWEQYPLAFKRLRGLLGGRRGALLVTGDVHRNAVYDDSGIVEIVCSGVARDSIVFQRPRKNYAILTFGALDLRVELRSLKVGWRFDFRIPLADWQLP